MLVLETIFIDEIRNPNQLPGFEREVSKRKEMKMACELIENLATDFNPQKYEDTYRKQLLEMIQAKIAGEQIAVPEMPQQGKVVDLMDALKASVEMAKKTTGKSEKKSKRKRKKAAGE